MITAWSSENSPALVKRRNSETELKTVELALIILPANLPLSIGPAKRGRQVDDTVQQQADQHREQKQAAEAELKTLPRLVPLGETRARTRCRRLV